MLLETSQINMKVLKLRCPRLLMIL